MAKYRVVPRIWPYGGKTFTRGEVVDGSVFQHNETSFLRLGLITPVNKTKQELVEEAKALGITVPKSVTKAKLETLIANHG